MVVVEKPVNWRFRELFAWRTVHIDPSSSVMMSDHGHVTATVVPSDRSPATPFVVLQIFLCLCSLPYILDASYAVHCALIIALTFDSEVASIVGI